MNCRKKIFPKAFAPKCGFREAILTFHFTFFGPQIQQWKSSSYSHIFARGYKPSKQHRRMRKSRWFSDDPWKMRIAWKELTVFMALSLAACQDPRKRQNSCKNLDSFCPEWSENRGRWNHRHWRVMGDLRKEGTRGRASPVLSRSFTILPDTWTRQRGIEPS